MSLRRSIVVLFVLVLGAVGTAVAQTPEAPWLAGPFRADPEPLLAAAAAIPAPPGSDVLVLLRDENYRFDDEGRATTWRRWVYRILTAEGLADWSVSEAVWWPRRQLPPEVRLRVVLPGGREVLLETSSFTEADAGDGRRVLRAELPEAAVGAVVEEVVLVRDRGAAAAGRVYKHLLAMPAPVHRGRLTLEAPSGLPLRFRARGLADLVPARELADGRLRLTFDASELPAAGEVEPGLPADVPRYPHVSFATGESWEAVAAAWAPCIEAAAAGFDAAALLRRLPRRHGEAQTERLERILERLHERVKPLPQAAGASLACPVEDGARGGSVTDMAALLAAALAADGVPAYAALLRRAPGMDIEPELPGRGRFDHALVYLPAGEPMWIEVGDRFSRAGELSAASQGRWALVVRPGARRLVRTPVSPAADNRTRLEIEVFLAEAGAARVVETSEMRGEPERRQRRLTAGLSPEDRHRGYLAYLRSAYRAEQLGEVEESVPGDLAAPFRLRLEALAAGRGWTSGGEAAVAIQPRELLTGLPAPLLAAADGPRRGDFELPYAFINEWHYRIVPPAGMRPRPLPPDRTVELGTGRLGWSFRLEGDVVLADFRLDSGLLRLVPRQFETYRVALRALLEEEPTVLWFERPGTGRGSPGR